MEKEVRHEIKKGTIQYEMWLRCLPELYHHATEECKAILLRGDNGIIGSEYLSDILKINSETFISICAEQFYTLSLQKYLGII